MGWINLSNATLALGKRFTSSEAMVLRDNPIAIANGDPGAPRLQGAAVARPGNGLPILAISAADTYDLQYGLWSLAGALTTGASDVMAIRWGLSSYSGTVRCRASHNASGGADSILTLYKNSVLQASFTTGSGSPVPRVYDLAIAGGDIVEWRHRSSSGAETSTVSATAIRGSDAFVPIVPLIPASLI